MQYKLDDKGTISVDETVNFNCYCYFPEFCRDCFHLNVRILEYSLGPEHLDQRECSEVSDQIRGWRVVFKHLDH